MTLRDGEVLVGRMSINRTPNYLSCLFVITMNHYVPNITILQKGREKCGKSEDRNINIYVEREREGDRRDRNSVRYWNARG